MVNLRLFRQFFQHGLFGTSQHERMHDVLQLLLLLLVLIAFDGHDELLREVLVVAQQARVDKLEEVPQLAQVVLHRCTSQHHTVVGLYFHGCCTRLRSSIFNNVRLVQAGHIPMFLCEDTLNAQQNAIRGHNHITSLGILYHLLTVSGEVEYLHVQRWSKSFHLSLPVGRHRGWRHHEGGAFVLLQEQEGDGLDGLSQTHIVSQQCTCSPAVQACHPQIAILLIGSQSGVQFFRDGGAVFRPFENALTDV